MVQSSTPIFILPPEARLPVRYQLSRPTLLASLLPSLLRKPRQRAWLQALLSPLEQVYAQFADHVASTTRELSYTGQTLLLQQALNDRFDPALRRIRILNADTELSPVYLNFVREQQPAPILFFEDEQQPPLYLYRYVELASQVGFTVRVPRALSSQEAALNTRISQLKLALIRHTIVYF